MEYTVMGVNSLEDRNFNREVVRYDRFEAMQTVRAFLRDGVSAVLVLTFDGQRLDYSNTPHWEYLFDPTPQAVVGGWINQWELSITDNGGDIVTFKIDLATSTHFRQLVTQLIQSESRLREYESVPYYWHPDYVRSKLDDGYLQTMQDASTIDIGYPPELEDWLNEVFADYVVFIDGVANVLK